MRRIRPSGDEFDRAISLPADFQTLPQFLVGHVQIALRLLDARMAEHQLNDANVDAVRQQSRGALVSLCRARHKAPNAQPLTERHGVVEGPIERIHRSPPVCGHGWTTERRLSRSTFA